MRSPRLGDTVTLLNNGTVLAVGGFDSLLAGSLALVSAEVYYPDAETWRFTATLNDGRAFHTATRLNNGKVLVAGGVASGGGGVNGPIRATTELFS
jgi:hypothetical protein